MENGVVSSIERLDSFDDEVVNSDKPVLVDFWAPWCGPCKQVAPAVEAMAQEFSDALRVAKVDVSELNDLAVRYDVRAIPMLMIFKGGEIVARKAGAVSKEQLAEFVRENI